MAQRIEGMWVREPGENKPWLGRVIAAEPATTGQVFYLLVMSEPDGDGCSKLATYSSAGVIVADDNRGGGPDAGKRHLTSTDKQPKQ